MSFGTSAAEPTKTASAATQPSAATIRQAMADLASSDSDVREAARQQLVHLKRDQLPDLEQFVRRAMPLAPSQVTALRQIVQEVYLSGEPYEPQESEGHKSGFLGIMMDAAAVRVGDLRDAHASLPGVVVADRIPGFCASRMLRDGDVILGTIHPRQVFASITSLQLAIGSVPPGSEVHLQVLRQGQVIDVTLTLDVRPAEANDPISAENFRFRRSAKFQEYWQATFAPILKESVG